MEKLKCTNPEVLQEKGLQLKENEDGSVTAVPYEVPLVNGGKWLPKKGEHYYSVSVSHVTYGSVLEKVDWIFSKDSYDTKLLRCGDVFPEEDIVKNIVEKVNALYKSLKDEYWDNYKNQEEDETDN